MTISFRVRRAARRLPIGMLVFWLFLALCVGYMAVKLSIGVIGIADEDDATRFMETQVAWAVTGFMLLFGLVSSAITEWVARSPMTAAGDQAWFWTPEWQSGEREADEDIALGRLVGPMDGKGFGAYLDSLDREAD